MKKVTLFTIVAFAILLFSSCDKKQRAIDNLSDLVEKVEKNASDYTEEDWAEVDQQFDKIIAEIDKYDYSSNDSKRISKLKGKYSGIRTRNSISKFVDGIDKAAKEVKGAIEGFTEGLTGENNSEKEQDNE